MPTDKTYTVVIPADVQDVVEQLLGTERCGQSFDALIGHAIATLAMVELCGGVLTLNETAQQNVVTLLCRSLSP